MVAVPIAVPRLDTPDVPSDPVALLARHAGLLGTVYCRFVKLIPHGGDTDELMQCLRLALIDAGHRFDPSRGGAFSTLAMTYLNHTACRFVRGERKRGLTFLPLADRSSWPRVVHGTNAGVPCPTDTPLHWSEEQWERVFACVGERDRVILDLRFREGWNLDEIGDELGLTKERIRQLIVAACARIRERCPWLADERG